MKYVVLGSSAYLPSRRRNCSAALLACDAESALVDCGPRTVRQLRNFGQPLDRISFVWLSHSHGDHTWGLPSLVRHLERLGSDHVLHVYANGPTLDRVDAMLAFNRRRAVTVRLHLAESGLFHQTRWFSWRTFPLAHRVSSNGLVVSERVPDGRKIVCIPDTMAFDGLAQHCRDADLLVCESTIPRRLARLSRSFKHMTASQAADLARSAHVGRLVLTHISRWSPASALEREARAIFPNTIVAEDFSVFNVHDRHHA